ncbi:MAG TPA: fused MFS/spermidine synthase [Streptosporangiaceae bacterium]|nr:fused MFS/spermidine synthase [Streptosporangiaceae bacterium]
MAARREPRTRRDTGPLPGRFAVASGEAELLRDLNRPGGWVLSVEGVLQSYVDLDDPTYLDFEYMQCMGDVVDCLAEPGRPLDMVHVGGGACTLPRYVAATRPGSRQLVFEPDGALVDLVRERLELRAVPRLRVRVADGRGGVAGLRDAYTDVIVVDAFDGASVPVELVTVEFTRDVARALRPGGTWLLNIADGPGLRFARRVVATALAVFPEVAVLADPGVLRGRRFGNLVVVGSAAELPAGPLTRRAAGRVPRVRCVYGDDVERFTGGVGALRDGDEIPLPVPPSGVITGR